MSPATSIRPFIGTPDFTHSRAFYLQLGFEELVIGEKMSLFKVTNSLSFYLQDYYVKDWVDNSMILLEVDYLTYWRQRISDSDVLTSFPSARISGIQATDHGEVMYLHDPAGVLWHFYLFAQDS